MQTKYQTCMFWNELYSINRDESVKLMVIRRIWLKIQVVHIDELSDIYLPVGL